MLVTSIFSILPQCLQKASFSGSLKAENVFGKGLITFCNVAISLFTGGLAADRTCLLGVCIPLDWFRYLDVEFERSKSLIDFCL